MHIAGGNPALCTSVTGFAALTVVTTCPESKRPAETPEGHRGSTSIKTCLFTVTSLAVTSLQIKFWNIYFVRSGCQHKATSLFSFTKRQAWAARFRSRAQFHWHLGVYKTPSIRPGYHQSQSRRILISEINPVLLLLKRLWMDSQSIYRTETENHFSAGNLWPLLHWKYLSMHHLSLNCKLSKWDKLSCYTLTWCSE